MLRLTFGSRIKEWDELNVHPTLFVSIAFWLTSDTYPTNRRTRGSRRLSSGA